MNHKRAQSPNLSSDHTFISGSCIPISHMYFSAVLFGAGEAEAKGVN
jgi:hypothetical protein